MLDSPSAETPAHRDRTVAIVVAGILVVLLGLLCFGLLALTVFGATVSAKLPGGQATPTRTLVPAILLYGLLGVFFILVGIGAIAVKRPARALLHAVGWVWLTCGALGTLVAIFLLPKIFATMAKTTPPGPAMPPIGFLVGCVALFCLVFYVALPLGLALFFGGLNVRATFAAKDPRPNRFDDLPLPLRALAVMLGWSSISLLGLPLYGALPFFGVLVEGPALWLLGSALAGALGYATLAVVNRSIHGWWATLALGLLGAISTAAMLLGGFDWAAYYQKLGIPPQPEAMDPAALFADPVLRAAMIAAWLAGLGYLLWTRKFFYSARR